ncbi:NADP-specific glutamate dehydrogenase [Candidatus Bathyarchaeota archaeon]|nr:NADP-specific glutamate dehydrogenase [Candidatus Bathyarchaeota archaeon]MBL7079629.1 NADP-specific glutamate dehydrogenase [Candidatus Bathyarchaeota archaeon]
MDSYVERVYNSVVEKDPDQKVFHQAVFEVLENIAPAVTKFPVYKEHKILERIVEPERIVQFRVPWKDRNGEIQLNRGFRIQYNSAIGPYKGGFRFHPTVVLGLLKFLGFEQTFKNSLTGLPMGGGKGGSDFDPKGKIDSEVENFCTSFMMEMYRHIGQFIDVPAGDIGVGAREIGYMYGAFRKITNVHGTCVLTGKGPSYGGSLIRPQATGYGDVYFVEEMLKTKGEELIGKVVTVSGSGNVSQYAVEKCLQLGAKVITMSDSNGCIYVPDGITKENWDWIMELKNVRRGRIKEFAEQYNVEYTKGGKPWVYKCDVALPCATQNELNGEEAQTLVDNGVLAVGEGANMPTTLEGINIFLENKILFSPGKASNAGGVSTSGLEMAQNSQRYFWSAEEVDQKLHQIMVNIHSAAYETAKLFGQPGNYVLGANIAGFLKVADAMVAQGHLA